MKYEHFRGSPNEDPGWGEDDELSNEEIADIEREHKIDEYENRVEKFL